VKKKETCNSFFNSSNYSKQHILITLVKKLVKRDQNEATYQVRVFVFREMKLHCNEFLLFQSKLKKTTCMAEFKHYLM